MHRARGPRRFLVELPDPALDVLHRLRRGSHHEERVHSRERNEVDPRRLPALRPEIEGPEDRLEVFPHLLGVQELQGEQLDPRRAERVGVEQPHDTRNLLHVRRRVRHEHHVGPRHLGRVPARGQEGLEHFRHLGRRDVLKREGLQDRPVGRGAILRPSFQGKKQGLHLRLGHRYDVINIPLADRRRAVDLQDGEEQLQCPLLADGPLRVDGHHAADPRVDEIVDPRHRAEGVDHLVEVGVVELDQKPGASGSGGTRSGRRSRSTRSRGRSRRNGLGRRWGTLLGLSLLPRQRFHRNRRDPGLFRLLRAVRGNALVGRTSRRGGGNRYCRTGSGFPGRRSSRAFPGGRDFRSPGGGRGFPLLRRRRWLHLAFPLFQQVQSPMGQGSDLLRPSD